MQKAQVNGINGIIILPDNWNSSTYSLSYINNPDASYNGNVISISNWTSLLEANGAVFIPANGYRDNTSVADNGINGYYWSANRYDDQNAYVFYFTDSYIGPDDYGNRSFGLNVRLVQNY